MIRSSESHEGTGFGEMRSKFSFLHFPQEHRSLHLIVAAINISVLFVIAFGLYRCLRHFDPIGFTEYVGRPYVRSIIRNSIAIGFWSAFFSSLIGAAFAFVLHRTDFLFRKPLFSIVRIPFVLPSIMIIISLASVFGVSGMFPLASGFLYSRRGIILTHSYYSFPVVFLSLCSALAQRKADREESFRVLGANRFLTFLLILLPSVLKTLVLCFMLSFFGAFFSFTIVMTFGGMKAGNIESEIYKTFSTGDLNAYSGLCMLSVLFSVLFAICSLLMQKSRKNEGSAMLLRFSPPASSLHGLAFNAIAVAICLAVLFPLFSIISSSFLRAGRVSFSNYASILSFVPVIVRSAVFSLSVSIVSALSVVLLAAYSKRTGFNNTVVLFAGSLSGIVLSSALAVFPHFSLFMAHVLMTVPFSYYMIKGEYDAMKSSLIEGATLVSSSDCLSVFYVELSNLKHVLANVIAFSFALSFCDVTSTLLLSRGRFYTASMLLYQAVSRYNFGLASALSVVMGLLIVLIYSAASRIIGTFYGAGKITGKITGRKNC